MNSKWQGGGGYRIWRKPLRERHAVKRSREKSGLWWGLRVKEGLFKIWDILDHV